MTFSVFKTLSFCVLFSSSVGDENKRILLNDPVVLGNRLLHLESTQRQLLEVIAALNRTVSEVQAENVKLKQTMSASQGHGSSYVRWGRTQCKGSKRELVYSGYAAGQYYTHSVGGPSNTLCLPDDPQISNSTFTATYSLIRGTEYEGNNFASNSHDEDMPCAVCRSIGTTSAIMIPGRQTCYTGWNIEYEGFLGSGHENYSASDYICVDSNPEYIPSGKAGNDGHVVYMVGIKCGPLPCPPYDNNRKVNCIVCSK